MVKMAVFGGFKMTKLISHKIWVSEKSWIFHIEHSLLGYPGLKQSADLAVYLHFSFFQALVNAQGKLCSRCIFNLHCHGCITILPENDTTDILLQINDTIAITYTTLNETDLDQANYLNIVQHESMNRPRIKDKLSLSDCLEAFSRTEELDESNPWYCPMCRKNKCATKTLSVWRFPDYLIIYLKRYVVFNTNFQTMHDYFCSLSYVKSSWVFPFSEKKLP